MIFKYTQLSIYLFVCAFYTNAQTNNVWVSGNDKVNFIFTPSNTIAETNSYCNSGIYPFNSICNSKGQLQILLASDQSGQSALFDWASNKIPNSEIKLNTYENYLLSFPNNKYRLIYSMDSNSNSDKQNTLDNILRRTDGVYLNQVDYLNGKYSLASKDIQILNKNVLNLSACRKNDSTYLAVLNTPNKLYSLLIFWDKIILVDSISVTRYSCLPDSIKNNSLIKTSFNTFVYLSHDGTKLILNEQNSAFYSEFVGNIFTSSKFGSGCSSIKNFNIDPISNKFINNSLVDATYLTYKVSEGLVNPNLIFSPNSKILYAFKSSDSINLFYNRTEIWQYNLDDFSPGLNKKLIYFINLPKTATDTYYSITNLPRLSPNGEYVFCITKLSLKPNKLTLFTNSCKSTNESFPMCNLVLNTQSFSLEKYGTYYLSFSNKQIYDYVRVNYKTTRTKSCTADIRFINKSDTSGGIYLFKYIIKKNLNRNDTLTGFEPSYAVSENGIYPFKVIGYGKYGYFEVYEDTIIVNSILSPKILKLNYPPSICRYQVFKLNADVIANEKDSLKYSWTYFIDKSGPLYHKQITHAFEDTGTFPLRLIFSNTYCRDTFDGKPIHVVDAPKPGFIIHQIQGCAPFKAIFLDTITKNVSSKDYWFSDNGTWDNIPINQFNFTHTFMKKGNYKVVQRLSGYSGCITQEDTIELHISAGLTQIDTLHIFNSTVANQNALIYWNKQEGAVNYQLFKDGMPFKQLKDTFFTENVPYVKDAIYSVKGIDSCGSYSSAGRIGKPMFLQGQMIGNNEASIIYFSPYQQWRGSDITYSIQKLVNGNWFLVNSEKYNAPYTDIQFLNKSELQACYRIEAFENSKPSLISHSNEVCIPYIPTLFVPTAFSPNDDGINDVYDITGFGLKSYALTVYNRWGQLVFNGADKQAWDGSKAAEGVYLIMVHYTTNAGIKLNQRVTVNLLK